MMKLLDTLKVAGFIFFLTVFTVMDTVSQETEQPEPESAISQGYKVIKNAQNNEASNQEDGEPQEQPAQVPEEQPTQKSEEQPAQAPEEQPTQKSEEQKAVSPGELQSEAPEGRGDDLAVKDQKPRYSSRGKRDPFKPFLVLVPTRPSAVTEIRPPIQRYSLDQFRLTGIVLIGSEPKAMVVDPENNTYFLGVGDFIGNKDGVIIEVRASGMLVEETTKYVNVYGNEIVEIKESVLAFQRN